MKSGMIGCEIFLTQTLRLTQDDIFLETKFREHKKNTLISSQYQRGKFIGCWTLGTRKLAKKIQKGGWK